MCNIIVVESSVNLRYIYLGVCTSGHLCYLIVCRYIFLQFWRFANTKFCDLYVEWYRVDACIQCGANQYLQKLVTPKMCRLYCYMYISLIAYLSFPYPYI